ncbi:unnamed protein product, partial [Choristocarpus tenellus]
MAATFSASGKRGKRRNRRLYGCSILLLVAYIIVSATRTGYFKLSILNSVTLLVLDSAHYSLNRGSTYWAPGFGILLMGVARISMMSFMAQYWLIGYSLAFAVYGGTLVREVVTRRLPQLSAEEAGAVAFLGHDPSSMKSRDMAANPELVLCYIFFYFVLVLVFLAYVQPQSLPQPLVPVWGQEWPAYIFG